MYIIHNKKGTGMEEGFFCEYLMEDNVTITIIATTTTYVTLTIPFVNSSDDTA